jgi:signal transduction histidine kinase
MAVLAALLLVSVLSILIVESRAVKEDYYLAHASRMRAIETSRNDIAAIVEEAGDVFENGRPVSASAQLAFARLGENNALLQAAEERLREIDAVNLQLADYEESLRTFVLVGEEFSTRQNSFAEALRSLQDESPLLVKDLRRLNLRLQSQNTFSLAIDIIEHATGVGEIGSDQLEAQVKALRDDAAVDSTSPGIVDEFVRSALAVIEQRRAAAAALKALRSHRIADTLWSLSDTVQSENRRTVRRAEMARLLLSVCTVLLLVGTGYAMFRLQASYRQLNKSNRELETVNDTLEERVVDRTEQLSTAIEDLKESQVQLVQAEKMSSLGELVAGISHEINTPLWYLISNATVLQERLDAISDFCGIGEKMIKAVQTREGVKEAVGRGLKDMQTMLRDGLRDDIDEARDLNRDSIEGLEELTELAQSLKDFSRLDRAQRDEFNVNEGLDKTLLIVRNRLKNKAAIHKHYGDVPPVYCSPSQINQIFLNLLTNAADAIEESGDIVIRTAVENNEVRVSIADTGAGMPEDVLARVRDPFFTTKEIGKGTGLGLSIVDQIVTSHGGDLLIDSEPGKGTTVTVVLPLHADASTSEAEEPESIDTVTAADAANDPDIETPAEDAAGHDGIPGDAPSRASV